MSYCLVIDFIGALLAKDPEERMSMTDALDHLWLSEPASQESDSQRYPLGGDSVFEIESFDDDNLIHEDESDNGDWSRPPTVSGTNLASGMGLDQYPSCDSADDFSQPLQQLRLKSSIGHLPPTQSRLTDQPYSHESLPTPNDSKHSPPTPDRMIDHPNVSPPPQQSSPLLASSPLLQHNSPLLQSSPPSPPLTDERMGSPAPAIASSPHLTRQDSHPKPEVFISNGGTNADASSLVTPEESMVEPNQPDVAVDVAVKPEDQVLEADTSPNTATKRKVRDLDAFSSGSLSPPPTESIELSSPADKRTRNGETRPETPVSERSTRARTREVAEASGRRTTRSTVKPDTPVRTPTTRGRKSMRLL